MKINLLQMLDKNKCLFSFIILLKTNVFSHFYDQLLKDLENVYCKYNSLFII